MPVGDRTRHDREPWRRHTLWGAVVLLGVVVLASLWYWLVEGFDPVEAGYQTIMTVSTVGFEEVHPLGDRGRIVTSIVIVVGVGAALFTLTGLFESIVETTLDRTGRRRMEHQIANMTDHVVVCGYGRIGAKVAELLSVDGPVLVIESAADRVDAARSAGFVVISGDATEDDVLSQAGLERARILAAALPTDADNLFVVLTGRETNAELHIVARAQTARNDAKLLRAGADRVVNPEDIGARRLAAFAQRPAVSEFLDVVMQAGHMEFRLEEIEVRAGTELDGRSLDQAAVRERTGALVLAVRSKSGEFVTNPGSDDVLVAHSTLIAIGTDAELQRLADYATGV